MAVGGVNTNSTQAAVTGGTQRLAESFDTFLNLLTTQMKNQDPLSPMDSNQFTQQIVQMTGVEQQLLTNQLLQQLVTSSGDGVADAVSLIGKKVRAATEEAALVKGEANWIFRLDREAQDVKVEVLDENGGIVHVKALKDVEGGEHAFSWDGKNILGTQLADGGTYTLRVTATDAEGATVDHVTYIEGVVTAIEQVDGETYATIGGTRALWQTISSIGLAPTPDDAADTTATNDDGDDETTPKAA